MSDPMPIPATRRLNVSVQPGSTPGMMAFVISTLSTGFAASAARFLWRGSMSGDDLSIPFVSDPSLVKGPKGDKGDKGDSVKGDKGDAGAPGATLIGTATISQTVALVALSLGVHEFTVTRAGVAVGDNILLFPVGALPAGYAIHGAVVTAANTLKVTMTTPLLAIGTAISIPCRVMRIG
ncbi:hypothetical protein [Sphingomonas immobilis]|uniref:Uncharacterized protein n=1 Tax=Sphingomonas immobilis TaxID=3063997 RepID=A0ABT8ZVP5_9SPHN|nr:hypothetical protein [Sphingomonas sp. CA1-15]MDO7841070.1 hypothetical protein [Sphingomonas sp. CA1-15]